MDIWVVGAFSELFIRGSYIEKKMELVAKLRFLWKINWFFTPHSICLNISFLHGILHENVA